MPDSTSTAYALLSVMRDYRGAGALYDRASRVRDQYSHVELDPIHFIAAAALDSDITPRIRNLFEHYGMPLDDQFIEAAMHAIRPEHWTVTPGSNGDTVEPLNQDTRELFKRLAGRYDQYINARVDEIGSALSSSTWEWSVALIQVALELETPSVSALHATAFKLRS